MRARNIKPGFYTNEHLLECAPLVRILFTGLWCLADREGRLEDRPQGIKIKILPGDNCDVNSMLDELQSKGFIKRYRVNDIAYIQVLNFNKHQAPHVKEKASTIPAPDKHGANTMLAPPDSLIPDSLIPESPFLIPSSPNPVQAPGGCDPKNDFYKKCFQAVGERFPSMRKCLNKTPIMGWEAMGASFEAHVIPSLDHALASGANPKSFSYFTPIIEGCMQGVRGSPQANEPDEVRAARLCGITVEEARNELAKLSKNGTH